MKGVRSTRGDEAGCAVVGITGLLLCLAGFASFLLRQVADEPDACFADVVVAPPMDTRGYRLLDVDNGLRALVVSDPRADVAAASMTVGVGSLSDPEATPGLAHFLEHMLFTGNAKYPREGEYFDFVNSHGGATNAATGLEETHFHFSIPPAQLLPALERLIQFFVSPTLAPGMTEREKHAVSAEHGKNVAKDDWRFQRLRFMTTGNPHCALGKFGTGNLATLANASSAELRAFHERHYAPDRMGLVVVGSESLDKLEASVRALAGQIPKVHAEPIVFDEPPGPVRPDAARGLVAGSVDARGRAIGGRLIEFETVADVQAMRMVWYLPPLKRGYARKSITYITELLGDEGPGSLVSLLRGRLGWVDGLTAGASHDTSFFSEVALSLSLTADGMAHVDEVVALVFAAIAEVRSRPAERWRWEEDKQLAGLEWRFLAPQEPSSLSQLLSAALLDDAVPLCDAMRAPYAYRGFDAAEIGRMAAQLTPDTLLLYIGAKGLAAGAPDAGAAPELLQYGAPTGWLREQYYGLRFAVRPFSAAQLAAWADGASAQGASELRLPPPNKFIPTDFALVRPAAAPPPPAAGSAAPGPAAEAAVAPVLVEDSAAGRLWLYTDATFAQPRASVTCVLSAASVLRDARSLWASHVLVSLATDALRERAYPAAIAGLGASVGVGIEGLELTVSGYSHKLLELLPLAAGCVGPGAGLSEERFEPVRAAILRDLKAEQFAGSLATALTQLKLLIRSSTAYYDRLAAVPLVANLSWPDVQAQAAALLQAGTYAECLVAGNAAEPQAQHAFAILRSALGGPPLADGALGSLRQRVLSVPVGSFLWEADALDPEELNSAVALYYQVGSTAGSLREEACLELLLMAVQQSAFDQLRTVEQLGYSVGAQAYRAWSAQGVLLYAQSDTVASDYLDERFGVFLAAHAAVLRATTAAAFETMRAALIANLASRDRSLSERTSRLWSEIEMHNCAFDRASRLQAHAQQLELADVLAMYERTFLNATTRRKLAIRVRAPGEDGRPTPRRAHGRADRLAGYTLIPADGVDAWRAGCELLPAPTSCDAFTRAGPSPAGG